MGLSARPSQHRHCEELATKLRGNFALKRRRNPESLRGGSLDCFAALAMTAELAPHPEKPAKGGRLEGWPRATNRAFMVLPAMRSIVPRRAFRAPHHEGLVTQYFTVPKERNGSSIGVDDGCGDPRYRICA